MPALLREMGAASSKFFADSRYAEAFELSEVKTRNLAAIHAAVERRARGANGGASQASGAGVRQRLSFGLWVAPFGLVVALVLGLSIGAMFSSPVENDARILTSSRLSGISPFLDSGHQQRIEDGELRFVGHLLPTWDYMGTPERGAAANEVASYFTTRGVKNGVLLGGGMRVMARWEDGKITELVTKSVE